MGCGSHVLRGKVRWGDFQLCGYRDQFGRDGRRAFFGFKHFLGMQL